MPVMHDSRSLLLLLFFKPHPFPAPILWDDLQGTSSKNFILSVFSLVYLFVLLTYVMPEILGETRGRTEN